MKKTKKFLHGDSIIEVVLAIGIYSTIAILSINSMNAGLNKAQRSLEITMARNEIDSQAEALRFVHNTFVAEREYSSDHRQFGYIWSKIIGDPDLIATSDQATNDVFNINNYDSCQDFYDYIKNPTTNVGMFALNPRFLQAPGIFDSDAHPGQTFDDTFLPKILITDKNLMTPTKLYPRITYGNLSASGLTEDGASASPGEKNDEKLSESGKYFRSPLAVEGVFVNAVSGNSYTEEVLSGKKNPEYYDFYIRTCWNAPGVKTHSTLTTTVRLYNPEMIE